MTDLTEAVYALLTDSPEHPKTLVTELRQWTEGGVYKGDPRWLPGDVLGALDRLIIDGRAIQVGDGYRKMPERPAVKVDQQRSMFG